MINKDTLVKVLADYFDINGPEGTYAYNLVRCKESIGDEPLDFIDFHEFDNETVEDIAEYILMNYGDEL